MEKSHDQDIHYHIQRHIINEDPDLNSIVHPAYDLANPHRIKETLWQLQ
jgi:hypothetical protein